MTTVYLNGEFLPLAEAKVSVMDRGFLFGDGVYEVIPVYNGHLFCLEQHLTRLKKSLEAIKLTIPLTEEALEKILNQCVAYNGAGDQSIYLQCTRGFAPTRDHSFPADTKPTVFACSTPLLNKAAQFSAGIAAITLPDIRWSRLDIKAITLLANVLLREQAREQNAVEAILIRDGYALEGTTTNLFIVKENKIITPPLSNAILSGVTRSLVLQLAAQHGDPYEERNITLSELQTADEIWVTSSTREVVPVITLDNKPVSDGKPGPLGQKMLRQYQAFKQKFYA